MRLIAQKAPADWSEIIETSGTTVLNSLVHRRLVIKSGDRLNVYWDIFKDYLLSGNLPVVPYNYIPSSDVSSLLNICTKLLINKYLTSGEIGQKTALNEKTIWNIGADLVMLGLAERDGTSFKVSSKVSKNDEETILKLLRNVMSKHALKLLLFKNHAGKTINHDTILENLKICTPKAKFGDKTWSTYCNRLTNYLIHTGFLLQAGRNIVVQDTGTIILDRVLRK